MDKFDEAKKILLDKTDEHKRPELEIVLGVVADTMRGIEQIGADIDRIATAIEHMSLAFDRLANAVVKGAK